MVSAGRHQEQTVSMDEGVRRQREFARASSHSSRVRLAKVALPVIAVVALVVTGIYMWASRVAPAVDVDISGSSIRDGKLVMANPKLDGFASGDRPYSVRAERAVQDLTGTGVVDLDKLEATVPMGADDSARIIAPSGVYDSDANKLDLTAPFSVETKSGMRAELSSAAIDLGNGSMKTGDPVNVTMSGTTLRADAMEIEDGGKRMLFKNSVKLVIQPEALEASASESAADGKVKD